VFRGASQASISSILSPADREWQDSSFVGMMPSVRFSCEANDGMACLSFLLLNPCNAAVMQVLLCDTHCCSGQALCLSKVAHYLNSPGKQMPPQGDRHCGQRVEAGMSSFPHSHCTLSACRRVSRVSQLSSNAPFFDSCSCGTNGGKKLSKKRAWKP